MSQWIIVGRRMVIDLENAGEQYQMLGYLHRTELQMKCPVCRRVTSCDASIAYKFCPHCGEWLETEYTGMK